MMEYARVQRAVLVSLLPELRCETFWEQVVQPLGGIVLMQSFPLHVVHRQSSPLAFANGQYILIQRSAYDAAGGHAAVRDRFVEDIAMAGRVKKRGLPIRVALVQGIVTAVLAVSGSYEKLFSYVTFVAWVFYGLTVTGVLVLRRKYPDLPRPYKMWGYPVTPVLFAAIAFGFVINTLVTTPGPSLKGIAIVASGVPVYYVWKRKARALL